MSVLCYNKGCGQRFDPENNPDDVCTYHPGVPVFHDALKGWSCCKRRTTDFSDFLSIAGCTKGPHNKEKPPEPVKPEVKTSGEKKDVDCFKPKCNESIIQAPKPAECIRRPSPDEPIARLEQKVSASLKQALEKLKLSENTPDKTEEEGDEVKIGTSCKNGGCSKTFNGPESDEEVCSFHAGVPIFHEGMKYWSCCKRKTSDFNTFLSQEGCSKGKHLWRKKDTGKKVVPCRFDWHQTGSQVTITVYAKNSVPELSYVDGNSTTVVNGEQPLGITKLETSADLYIVTVQRKISKLATLQERTKTVFTFNLDIHIIFDGDKEFERKIILWGVIDASKSIMNMAAAKIEIVLKKAEPMSWGRLDLPPVTSPPKEKEKKKESDSDDDDDD